ncbi:MAG: hypothetical protein EOP45_13445, partial [Sphingobacteriaceae bacterium]
MTQKKITITRDSVAIGDDVNAPHSKIIEVNEAVDSQCGSIEAKYRIGKKAGQLNIWSEIEINGDQESIKNEAQYQNAISKVKACLPHAEGVFRKLGIKLNVALSRPGSSSPLAQKVTLVDKPDDSSGERSNSSVFFLQPDPIVAKYGGRHELCEMITHELGHHLGFADEYFEPGTCHT